MKRIVLAALCMLSLAACGDPVVRERSVVVEAQDPATIADPAERGRAEARAAIAAGELRVLTFGLPDFSKGDVDPRTGLRYDNHGCEISHESVAHADAFNAEMLRAVDAGELDGKHLRDKMTTRSAALALFDAEPGNEIALDSGPVAAPGGRFSVEIALHPETEDPYLWVLDGEAETRRELTWFDGERARVLFSADGETLFLRDAENHIVQTHDLPTAAFMQGWEGEDEDFAGEPEPGDDE